MDEKESEALSKRMPCSSLRSRFFQILVFRIHYPLKWEFLIEEGYQRPAFVNFNSLRQQTTHTKTQWHYWQVPFLFLKSTFPTLFANYLSGNFIKYWHIIHILTSCSVNPYQKFCNKSKKYQYKQYSYFNKAAPTNKHI